MCCLNVEPWSLRDPPQRAGVAFALAADRGRSWTLPADSEDPELSSGPGASPAPAHIQHHISKNRRWQASHDGQPTFTEEVLGTCGFWEKTKFKSNNNHVSVSSIGGPLGSVSKQWSIRVILFLFQWFNLDFLSDLVGLRICDATNCYVDWPQERKTTKLNYTSSSLAFPPSQPWAEAASA